MARRGLRVVITVVVLYAALKVLLAVFSIGGGQSQPGPSTGGPSDSSVKSAPTIEEIQARMQPDSAVARREGTAVAVLVDTSGSMREQVADVGGQPRAKMDIAKRCLADLAERCDAFATAHPDKTLLLGIYEFSERKGEPSCRQVVRMTGKITRASIEPAIEGMRPSGDTPIGEAMIAARKDLNRTGLTRTHILVITDGENNRGVRPERVAAAIGQLPEESRSSIYFVAFDVAASQFKEVRDAGGLVLPASSGSELGQALDYILTGKILAEQPEAPAAGG